jgi:CelD/BcsL family acetyltransferase involved in cellulose biosynthesis
VLAEDRVRRFHSTAAPRLLQEGMLHLSRLRVNNRTRAVIFSLLSGDTTFCYLQGFDPEFSQLSPGTQLMFSAIKNAVSRGMRNFDFLRGDESYKQHWRAEKKPTYRIEIARTAIATLLEPSTERTAA